MLGLAIGDALGVTTEGLACPSPPKDLSAQSGTTFPTSMSMPLSGFLPTTRQMAFWTLEQMLDDGVLRARKRRRLLLPPQDIRDRQRR